MSGTAENLQPPSGNEGGSPPPANENNPSTAAPAGEGGGGDGGEGSEPAKPAQPQWVDKRIARYTYLAKEAERQRDATAAQLESERQQRIRYETELAILRGGGQPPAQPGQAAPAQPQGGQAQGGQAQGQGPTQQAIEEATARLRAEAQQHQAEAQFNTDTNSMVDKGRAAHPDFNHAINGWHAAGLNIATPQHRELIGLINSLPDGPDLFYRIGTNPDLAEHIANLSPVRAAYEIRGLSAAIPGQASATAQALAAPAAQPVVSNAPRPPSQPAAPRGTAAAGRSLYDPNLSAEDFARLRGRKK